jgi:hypothetical protein
MLWREKTRAGALLKKLFPRRRGGEVQAKVAALANGQLACHNDFHQ